ncbi:MAG: ATP synthase F1 subunit gamma [Bacteriovoracaceae bacterium]|nr:ATP synthase F1 subunit gamma [Bacteriovoracaceae bacterium]
MAGVKDLKKKIKSTKGTHKITSAMKLVSAAKLARAQSAIQGARPYAGELEKSIKTISALVQGYEHPFLAIPKEEVSERALILVISSDKGLCGGFNSNLTKAVRAFIKNNPEVEFKFYFIGKKVRDVIKQEVNEGKTFTFARIDPSYDEIRKVAEELSHLFMTGEVGKVFVAYNSFKSAMSIEPKVSQVLPMTLPQEEKEKLKEEFPFDFKYEPAPSEILNAIIPQVYVSSLYTKMLDSVASEHGSRMTAMDSATKNSKEMIRTLTLKMNKVRQAAITTELIEVISGAQSQNA